MLEQLFTSLHLDVEDIRPTNAHGGFHIEEMGKRAGATAQSSPACDDASELLTG